MISRLCPKCAGELVLARRSDEQCSTFSARPSNYWRCSTCGGEFTSEQVRENKRSKQFAMARPLDQPSVTRQGDDGGSPRMGDGSPSVVDATGYSVEEQGVDSRAEETS